MDSLCNCFFCTRQHGLPAPVSWSSSAPGEEKFRNDFLTLAFHYDIGERLRDAWAGTARSAQQSKITRPELKAELEKLAFTAPEKRATIHSIEGRKGPLPAGSQGALNKAIRAISNMRCICVSEHTPSQPRSQRCHQAHDETVP